MHQAVSAYTACDCVGLERKLVQNCVDNSGRTRDGKLTVSSVLVILLRLVQSKCFPGQMRLPATVISKERPRETTLPVSKGRFCPVVAIVTSPKPSLAYASQAAMPHALPSTAPALRAVSSGRKPGSLFSDLYRPDRSRSSKHMTQQLGGCPQYSDTLK